ncbi:MAG: flagellar hook-associated protein 3 [Nevskiaceae bacterium]|nr:MAG: flagellar hook-associated protein 3 [Nevskiaceae bacterium]TBR71564.1 MAG: flagellar hook-associated protein 3 [Nevskiaceae bacterium]
MAIRITEGIAYRTALSSMQRTTADLGKTQLQLSTGQKFQTAAEDPTAAAQVQNLNAQLANLVARNKTLDTARLALQTENQALTDAQNVFSQASTLAVQAGNPTLSASDREDLAQQIDSLKIQLTAIANRSDANGKPIFGGGLANGPAFTTAPGGAVSYAGGDQPTWLQVDAAAALPAGDTGREVFMTSSNGDPNTPSTQSLFKTLDDLSAAIRTADPAQRSAALASSANALNAGASHITRMATRNGGRLNALDTLESAQQTQATDVQQVRSAVGDVDYAKAASQLTLLSTALQAAQQSFIKIRSLSLFNFMH